MNIRRILIIKNSGQSTSDYRKKYFKKKRVKWRPIGFHAFLVELRKDNNKYYWKIIKQIYQSKTNANVDAKRNRVPRDKYDYKFLYKKRKQVGLGIANFSIKDLQ